MNMEVGMGPDTEMDAGMETYMQIISEIKASSSEEYADFCRKMIRPQDAQEIDSVIIGCRITVLRKMARRFWRELAEESLLALLQSVYNEARTLALIIMVMRFQNRDTSTETKKHLVDMYLDNLRHLNNWGLVDISAYHIIGEYFSPADPIFKKLANSNNLWENRIAIVATFAFIKRGEFAATLALSEKFMEHKHHLIHKACGWMLREVGKRNETVLVNFLRQNREKMPRIMLSYAKEKLHDL
ncbi:MAG: DNA alkylation repair protein [Holosporaceae bacterium]|nr:DNA alkylation repair protein [Holosporaceae bacterium]